MLLFEIRLDPGNKMVLESTLYCLMEEVRSEQLIDICTREAGCEWLWVVQLNLTSNTYETYTKIMNESMLVP